MTTLTRVPIPLLPARDSGSEIAAAKSRHDMLQGGLDVTEEDIRCRDGQQCRRRVQRCCGRVSEDGGCIVRRGSYRTKMRMCTRREIPLKSTRFNRKQHATVIVNVSPKRTALGGALGRQASTSLAAEATLLAARMRACRRNSRRNYVSFLAVTAAEYRV